MHLAFSQGPLLGLLSSRALLSAADMHALQPSSSSPDHWTLPLLQFLLPYPSTTVASPGLPEFQGISPSGVGGCFTDLCGSFGREECAGSSGVPRRTASAHSGVGKRGWGWSGHVPLSLWASRPEFVMVECWTGSLGPQTLEPPTVSYHQPVTTFGAGYSLVRRALEGPSTLEAGGKGVERGLR